MNCSTEEGVLDCSSKFFPTPSSLAREVFFYVTRCGHYFCTNKYSFSWASDVGQVSGRRTFLMFYIRAGTMSLKLNQRSYRAGRDHVVLIDCRKPHEYQATDNLEFVWIHFDGANSADFFQHIVRMHGCVFSVRSNNCLFEMMATLVADCGRFNAMSEMERSQQLHAILCEMLLPSTNQVEGEATPVNHAIHYISLHLSEKLDIPSIAEQVGLSASHFSRVFHHSVGISPYEYIILKRIERAKVLLTTTDETVKSIAYMVGYSNETTFTAAFAEKVGVSPVAYRRLVIYLDL